MLGLLLKKKIETEEIKFIDIQDQDSNSNHIVTTFTNEQQLQPVIPNIVRFAEQEDDTDLVTVPERSNPADVVRRHLLAKVVTPVVQSVIVRGRQECESAVRFF